MIFVCWCQCANCKPPACPIAASLNGVLKRKVGLLELGVNSVKKYTHAVAHDATASDGRDMT